MNRFGKLLLVTMVVALAALLVLPAGAQDEGGIIIDSTFGSGPINFNPVTSTSATEQDVMNNLYPNLLGVNPVTGVIEPNQPGGLAESWEISDDGTVYTFKLRQGYTWTDGEPVTAYDWEYTWDAVKSGEVETNLIFLIDDPVVDMTAIDDYTLEVTFTSADCEALNSAGLQPIPKHYFEPLGFAAINEENFTDADDLEVGPYQLASQIPDQQTALIPATWDNPDGLPQNDGWVMRVFGDQTVEFQSFLAGETGVLESVAPNLQGDVISAAEDGSLQYYQYSPGDAWDYMAFNLANPQNPQAAYDESGNLIEQDPHPLFGDLRVRQAINMAVNVDDIIAGAVFGNGARMQSIYAPGSWPYAEDVPFYDFDPEAAAAMLEEAGWIDSDNDPSTPRVAQGAMYAEDGTEMTFTLFTNQGNTRRTAIGTIIQDQLAQVGIGVDFQTIDFNVLLDILDQQTYDTFILGWRNSYPFRADQRQLWATTSDVIAGDNFTSYINPELDDLWVQAATVPGCDIEARREIYGQIQQIFHEDTPYLFLYSINGMYAWNSKYQGVNPYPGAFYWNLSEWTVTE
ncbi:MAG: hypothetical protein KJ065_13880 [Anaerolineae bacterium]|nr:hypothetical protein [Anaerolineae bacterium]